MVISSEKEIQSILQINPSDACLIRDLLFLPTDPLTWSNVRIFSHARLDLIY